jgi:hypothetical protein
VAVEYSAFAGWKKNLKLAEARTSGEKEWKIRGGHRFWVGPEDFGKKESLSQNGDEALRQWIEPYVRQLPKRRVSDDEGTP